MTQAFPAERCFGKTNLLHRDPAMALAAILAALQHPA
jgi:hypothetical protein